MHASFLIGFEALRANPLRSLLSTLGVVMGVGALVSVLAMGDGVERYAREQLERTTDLLEITVAPQTAVDVDGQLLRRETYLRFVAADAAALRAALPEAERVGRAAMGGALVSLSPGAPPRGFVVQAVEAADAAARLPGLLAGAWFAPSDTAVAVLSARAAGLVAGDTLRPEAAVGATFVMRGASTRVVGVLPAGDPPSRMLEAYVPVDDMARALGANATVRLQVRARRIEDVDSLLAGAERWAAARYGSAWKDEVVVASRRDRVEQAATGMLIFKLLMGAITGVSLLVGGVGIMNVLLASVAERTREIGIRKAAGATNRDILVQFLAEAVAITGAGAAIGVVLGLSIAFGAAWVMRAQTSAPVYADARLSTVASAVVISVVIGLAFGLYPARRAARLSPIDAIRHET